MAVNRVELGNQVLMDITDTTATEADVESGKTFYKANGAKATGNNTTAQDLADLGLVVQSGKLCVVYNA